MKKILIMLFVLMLSLAIVACGNADKNNGEETKIQQTDSEQTGNEDPDNEPEKKVSALPEGIKPEDYAKFVQFELPENFRQAAVDYMKKMAAFEWTPVDTYTLGKDVENWRYSLTYEKGKTYRGLPYSSGNRALEEYIINIEENNGKFKDPTPADEIQNMVNNKKAWGVECNSSTNAAIQQFSPRVKDIARQYMPSFTKEFVGILLGDIKVTPDLQRTEYIVQENDAETIYAAYSELKLGDIILSKKEDKGVCHVRMISVEPEVVRNGTGKINPSRSYVKCVEQTDAFDKTRTDGVLTTWRVDKQYTFGELYKSNYLPITLEEYQTNVSVIPYLALDEIPSATTLAKGMLSGTVSSDFPIQYCYLELYNKSGELVNRCVKFENYGVSKMVLRNSSYSLFDKVEAGEYTLVIKAGLHCGNAELCRVDFTYNG